MEGKEQVKECAKCYGTGRRIGSYIGMSIPICIECKGTGWSKESLNRLCRSGINGKKAGEALRKLLVKLDAGKGND